MIAYSESLFGPTNLSPKPISNPHFSGSILCFNLGFGKKQGLEQSKKLLLLDHKVEKKMELIRKLTRGSFMDRRRMGQKVEVESVNGGEDVFDAVSVDAKVQPEHLVIMVNGMVGSSADWRYAAEQFLKRLPDKVIVHRSECNSSKLTFDGVDLMGERLAREVLDVVEHWPEVHKISFVAHSLGGLVARYAIGRLYDLSPKMETLGLSAKGSNGEHLNDSTQYLEQQFEARVAGLEPMNFITFATPHLGSRGHKQLPFLCGLPFLERRAPQTAHWVAGRSGKHLFLTDNDDRKPPLLLRMVNDSDDLKFITSSIRRQHELPKSNVLVKDKKYPHIVYVERETTENIHSEASSMAGKLTIDLEGTIWNQIWEDISSPFSKEFNFISLFPSQVPTGSLTTDANPNWKPANILCYSYGADRS
ncbi:hypothetical protein TEA_023029 [Camellia sinensis var. sinensis]|uniref:DUF676 domain-containing protein n=1 Tax=Camellia sinensis var. sinensis TaxID=542762 RepID=A0A4S4EZB6_CAMSN|nr:hypothetical protein TEA_023029 [Camellia sinensis var. sinensis]